MIQEDGPATRKLSSNRTQCNSTLPTVKKVRRYALKGMEPREWGNALIDHLVGPALTYWMYLQRTFDLSDWTTVKHRLLERFNRTMSQSEMLTELAKVRWNGSLKDYTDRFATVAERGMSLTPAELAEYYCTGLPTDLHLSITNDGHVKYLTWEQAATAATRFYEPKQSVLELRERNSRALRAAMQANGPRGRQEIENRSWGARGNCFECQGRGHPARVCPSKGERTKRPGETCKRCGGPNAIPVSLERRNQLLSTAEGTKTSKEHEEETRPLTEMRWKSGPTSILSEETPDATTNNRRKSAEATKEGHGSDVTEILPHWWRETYMKESYDQGGALCCVGATAVLRVELVGSPCEALLDTGASRSFISPKTVERLQLKVRMLPREHRFTVATGARLRIDRVVTGLTLWCGHARFSGDFLVGPVPYDLVLGLDWLTEHKVAWYFQSDKLRTYDLPVTTLNGQQA
ncbi:hypothetical protein ENH_00007820 [Eimeria necatrix]|uniref:Retrotransposon gag domain-containing protein n=1 Tax=Eimeria necatrix TaxID=51315 RepID=U6MNP1_9EIME|nr:hypothetical protein ENH_00007820 [Eimeria necatrix]CDJ65626.1 hypothetical protein ENH_00007820 [Eimeria necatrix]